MSELDTQELEYSMSLSSDEESTEESDSDESKPDLSNLRAYDFEPVCEPHSVLSSSDEEEKLETSDMLRIRNTNWCQC